MATNLPPEYFEADKRYRAAKTPGEKISCIQELLRIVPKHKGTDNLRAGLRKRLSKLKTGRLWGTAVYDGQLVQRDHVLNDNDIVELQI